jgi:hypothetical protein
MHPILARPERLAVYLAAWVVIGALISGSLVGQGLAMGEALLLVQPPFLVYSFVCLSAWYVCRAVPLPTGGAWRVLTTCVVSAAVAGGLWLAIAYLWLALLGSIPAMSGLIASYRLQIPALFSAAILLFLLALAVHYLGLAFEAARASEQRQFALQMHARDAELRALRAQLDPHFLYNCLNSIAALTTADAAGARRMCLLLAEFLRTTLHAGALPTISLGDELALADRFLTIEQVRFGDRLRIERRVDDDSLGCRVPPLFLQPLLENAVRHGIANTLDGGVIELQVSRTGEHLAIAIENPCDPDALTPMRHGTGLTNVRQRLAAMFGHEAIMNARAENGRFRVDVVLPVTVHD